MGPPSLICLLKRGTTDPEELRTLPNLTIENIVFSFCCLLLRSNSWIIISATRLEAPIIFVGLTALSVEIKMTFSISFSRATSHIFLVERTLFLIPCNGLSSTILIISFFSGLQLIALGILGEYIGRIYDEVKKRPKYIIDKKINFDE